MLKKEKDKHIRKHSSSYYDHLRIESKWQDIWLRESIYYPKDMISSGDKKFYNLWMFPYPSAEGLHAGHAFASTGSDVFGRFMRMNGYEVFQPIGYDSFGIHSENYAIKVRMTPQEMLGKTIKRYESQLKSLGHGYDWTRTVTTSSPDYYRWTQWLFLQMFKSGLAYRKSSSVNWCPSCKTVLADEQVMSPQKAGKLPEGYKSFDQVPEGLQVCERCGTPVERKHLEQWFFRITRYADRLLENLSKIDWPDKIKTAQRNWIGKKEGINITYRVDGSNKEIVVWTSRPETNFGATFIVLAPENPLCIDLSTSENIEKVRKYVQESLNKSDQERIKEGRKKTGVFTGSYAINELNNRKMPIFVADFVIADVGTSAVVGVPGHDKRDFEFAREFDLPVVRVVKKNDGNDSEISEVGKVYEGEGVMVNSGFLDGMTTEEARQKIIDYMEEMGIGKRFTNYHLRDWLISRQRYWGPPIPMIYCAKCASNGIRWFDTDEGKGWLSGLKGVAGIFDDWNSEGWFPVSEDELPVVLPAVSDFEPDGSGRGPLAKHPEFYEVKCPNCGSDAKRETDVSDTFLDSSWYFLRYPSVGIESSSKYPFDSEITRRWLPVDLYFGGAEHALLHLMYSRFVTMFLFDLGKLDFDEPFPKFFAHGLMIKDGAKMSKSRGNVVNPDHYVEKFGADTLRLYLMFMGPMDGSPDFRDTGIEGMRRFVDRIWRVFNSFDDSGLSPEVRGKIDVKMHQTIKKVTEDIKEFKYNTAIASIMEYVNLLIEAGLGFSKQSSKPSVQTDIKTRNSIYLRNLALILAPFAPHLAEEVWVNVLEEKFSIHRAVWPKHDPKKTFEETVTIAVQVNGKLRSLMTVTSDQVDDQEFVISLAKKDEKVSKWISGEVIKKEIYVKGKLVNFVV